MSAISTFLDMGGRAAFVWPAYGITALVLIGLLVQSVRTMRARERELGASERGGRRRERDPGSAGK
ncbi:MAG TPA: heme exporter protein CcmD [Alphaproteobacteria bacterium]|nr:heme exporter protein CcmD [Alphaproteobacteria bacterium]